MRYRISNLGLVHRLTDSYSDEIYNFKTKKWISSGSAIEAFYEGSETYEATEEEVINLIKKLEES